MSRKIICKATGCYNTIDADSGHKYCQLHLYLERRDQEKKPFTFHKELYPELYKSRKWQGLRALQLEQHPWCSMCGHKATTVDHIVAHNGDLELFYDPNNLQSLCFTCHNKKTQEESAKKRQEREKNKGKLWY